MDQRPFRNLKCIAGWSALALLATMFAAFAVEAIVAGAVCMLLAWAAYFLFLYAHFAPERERIRLHMEEWRRQKELGLTTLTEQEALRQVYEPSICTL